MTYTSESHTHLSPVAPATADGPDLTMYALIHRALRRGADRIAHATAELVERPDPARAKALERWYRGYLAELHSHHDIEDEIFFPVLLRRSAAMRELETRVESEHGMLLECMHQLQGELRTVAERPSDLGARRAAAATAHDLAVLMHAHLDVEDTRVFPIITETITGPEYDELEVQARKHGSMSTMAFALPFSVECADPDELAHLREMAGAPLKVLLALSSGRYRRRTRAAFGQDG